jgi:endonuclease I
VARAIFYFAARYKMKVGGAEEATLRKWNHEDPVDAEEAARNDMIEDVQGNRNPFVDYPELIDQVKVFSFNTTR